MKRLFLIPPGAIVAYFIARAVIPAPDLGYLHEYGIALACIWAGSSCVYAGLGFTRGDYLRRAWLAMGLAWLTNAIPFFLEPLGSTTAVQLLRGGLFTFTNILAVASVWIFARAYRAAGLELAIGRRARLAATIVSTAFAVFLAWRPVHDSALAVVRGNLDGIISAVSTGGDMMTCILQGPIIATVAALRGGLLVWIWVFLVGSNVSWLVLDAHLNVYAADWGGAWDALIVSAAAHIVAGALAQRRILAHEDEPA